MLRYILHCAYKCMLSSFPLRFFFVCSKVEHRNIINIFESHKYYGVYRPMTRNARAHFRKLLHIKIRNTCVFLHMGVYMGLNLNIIDTVYIIQAVNFHQSVAFSMNVTNKNYHPQFSY